MAQRRRSQDMLLREIRLDPPPPPTELAKARLAVCHYADNADEAKRFLDMLGLL